MTPRLGSFESFFGRGARMAALMAKGVGEHAVANVGLAPVVFVLTRDNMAVRHILCPIDLSEVSGFALNYSATLARTLGAKVTALHVVQAPPAVLLEETGMNYSAVGLAKAEERELSDLVRRSASGSETSVAIVSGHPATQIVEQAERLGADLIALGTHGRTGFKRLVLGSVAERVLRQSSVPVLTLRKEDAAEGDRVANIRNVLCPTDFSGSAQAALELAVEVSKRRDAKLHLLHVFQSPTYLGWDDGMSQTATSLRLMQELRERAQEQLDELVAQCKREGVDATAEEVDGVPHARIAAFSENCDLVVMGSHGRTGLPRLLLGSVAERTVRLARCPVLCVRGPESDEQRL